jgi:hypothetical protein
MAEPTCVLVHSPLVGPRTWRPTAEHLSAAGRRTVVPELVEAVTGPPPRYDAMAAAVLRAVGEADSVVLVVHSGAGALVPSIVARAPWTVHAVVFVDATLPAPGKAWADTAPPEMGDELRRSAGPDGLLAPWHEWFPAEAIAEVLPDPVVRAAVTAEIPRMPLGYMDEVAPAHDEWQDLPCAYVQLSAAYADAAAEAERRGWTVVRHEGHHLSTVTEPAVVASAILAFLDQLPRPDGPGRPG